MKLVSNELLEDEEQKRVIQIIKNHRRSGKAFYAIAQYLNKQGIPTKQGKQWHDTSVRNILNPQ